MIDIIEYNPISSLGLEVFNLLVDELLGQKQSRPSDESLMKCLYLTTLNIIKKWNGRYHN